MRALRRYYNILEKEIQTCANRLNPFLQLSLPLLEKAFSRSSIRFLNVVQLYPHPDCLKGLSKKEVSKQIKQATRKNISLKEAEEKAKNLMDAAENTHSAIKLTYVHCQHLKQIVQRIVELKQQNKETIKQMVNSSKTRTDFKVLVSFPGVEPLTAVRIIGKLGDICRFKNNKQINAYAGIDIQRYQDFILHDYDNDYSAKKNSK